MDHSGIGESSGVTVKAFCPGDPGAYRRLPGDRAIFPERAYQPGFFYGNADSPAFPRRLLGSVAVVQCRLNHRNHAHVCKGALPGRCTGPFFF